MNDDAREDDQLPVESLHRQAVPFSRATKVFIPHRKSLWRSIENTNSNWFLSAPQQGHVADESDVVAAVMPPSEVRPIGFGRCGDPEVVCEGGSFFLRPAADC